MQPSRFRFILPFALLLTWLGPAGRADADPADPAIAGAVDGLAASASSLATRAADSDDKAIRKKLRAGAEDLADDLSSLARRIRSGAEAARVVSELEDDGRDAQALVELADDATDKDERKMLRALAQGLVDGIGRTRADAQVRSAAAAKPRRPAPMTASEFASFLAAVDGASFDSDKLVVVQASAASNWFTAAQIAATLDHFDWDDGKVEAVVAMWPHVVNPKNVHVVFGKLDDDGKAKLKARLGL